MDWIGVNGGVRCVSAQGKLREQGGEVLPRWDILVLKPRRGKRDSISSFVASFAPDEYLND